MEFMCTLMEDLMGGGHTVERVQCGGGGATHIATIPGILNSLEGTKESILIVAGGGGGRNRPIRNFI